MALHADAIAEDGAAGEGAARIDCENADRGTIAAQVPDDAVDQSALSSARWSGDPYAQCSAVGVVQFGEELIGTGGAVLDRAQCPGQSTRLASSYAVGQSLH